MKKPSFLFFIFTLFVLLLSGCNIGGSPGEAALKEMLCTVHPECLKRYIYQEEVFELDKLEIIRRQTNKEEKTDKVDCRLFVHNENYEGQFNYTLYLNYWDKGGWQLDNCVQFDADEIRTKVNTLPKEITDNEVNYYTAILGALNFVEETFDSESGLVTRVYRADNKFHYLDVSGTMTIQYELSTEYWDGSTDYAWVPTYTDNIQQTWKFGSRYRFDYKPDLLGLSDIRDEVPKISGADYDGLYKGILSAEITDMTNEKIEMTLTIVNSEAVFFDHYSTQDVTFNIKDYEYSKVIFRNKDGDYIKLILDPNDGICVERYDDDSNIKKIHQYVPY